MSRLTDPHDVEKLANGIAESAWRSILERRGIALTIGSVSRIRREVIRALHELDSGVAAGRPVNRFREDPMTDEQFESKLASRIALALSAEWCLLPAGDLARVELPRAIHSVLTGRHPARSAAGSPR